MQRRALNSLFFDVRDVLRRSSQFSRDCSGAEAFEFLMNSAVDDSSNIVREDLIGNLESDRVSLRNVPESG